MECGLFAEIAAAWARFRSEIDPKGCPGREAGRMLQGMGFEFDASWYDGMDTEALRDQHHFWVEMKRFVEGRQMTSLVDYDGLIAVTAEALRQRGFPIPDTSYPGQ